MEKVIGIVIIVVVIIFLCVIFWEYLAGCLIVIAIPLLIGLGIYLMNIGEEKKDIQSHLPGSYLIEEDKEIIGKITFSSDDNRFTIIQEEDSEDKEIIGKYKVKVKQGRTEMSLIADKDTNTSWFKTGSGEEIFRVLKKKNMVKIYNMESIKYPPIKIYGGQFSDEPDWYFNKVE
ncbi:hypothetical protein [Pseudogracilibacillus sp. SO30301A]|uniref:hypothetical protein n=1 Tax=Pseudogracilibacillus sp. SO30301A TaxID=3098291 RepID=UPI00300E03AC